MTNHEPDQPGPPPPTDPTPTLAAGAAPSGSAGRPAWVSWVIASVITAVVVVGAMLFLERGADADTASGDSTPAQPGQAQNTPGGSDSTGGSDSRGGPGQGGLPGLGEVTSIDGSTLSISSQGDGGESRTVTIVTSSETVVSETVTGSLADLVVGETAIVVGEETDGGIVASSIAMGEGGMRGGFGGGPRGGGQGGPGGMPTAPPEGFEPPEGSEPPGGGFPGGGLVTGEIVEVGDAGVTIETAEGETVVVTAGEDLTVRVTQTRQVSDIEVGDTIMAIDDSGSAPAQDQTSQEDQLEATRIVIGDLGSGGFGPGGFGPGLPGGRGEPQGSGAPSGADA